MNVRTRLQVRVIPLALICLLSFCGAGGNEPSPELLKAYKEYHNRNSRKAFVLFKKVLADNPDSLAARLMITKMLFYNGKFKEAETVLEEARGTDDINFKFWYARILSQHTDDQKKLRRALELINSVLRTNSNYFEAWYVNGLIQEKLGKVTEAITSYQRATREEKKMALVHLRLAIIYKKAGRQKFAAKEIRRAKALGAGDPFILSRINGTLNRLKFIGKPADLALTKQGERYNEKEK